MTCSLLYINCERKNLIVTGTTPMHTESLFLGLGRRGSVNYMVPQEAGRVCSKSQRT